MIKFVANNNNIIFMKLTLFFALIGLYLHMSFDVIDSSNTIDISKVI